MTGNPCWQAIPTKLSLEQFEEFVLPHLSMGRRGPPPTLSLHKVFNYVLQLLYMGVSGGCCRLKRMPKVVLKSTTRASIGRCGDGRPMAASTGSLPAPCASFIRTSSSISRSFTATGPPLPQRREATTWGTAATSTHRTGLCLGGQVPPPAASLRASGSGPLRAQDTRLHDDQSAALLLSISDGASSSVMAHSARSRHDRFILDARRP
jgi:hypothetical protein